MPTTIDTAAPTAKAVLTAALLAVALSLLPAAADATTTRYASLDKLVDISDLVVRADVTARRSFFDTDQNRIVTHTTLDVDRRYAGQSEDTIVVEQWGGTVDGRTMTVPGDASFESGERVLVFLRQISDRDVYALSALAQSKYTVFERDGLTWVRRDLSGLNFVAPSKGADADDRYFRFDGMARRLPVFEQQLRQILDDDTGRPDSNGPDTSDSTRGGAQ